MMMLKKMEIDLMKIIQGDRGGSGGGNKHAVEDNDGTTMMIMSTMMIAKPALLSLNSMKPGGWQ